MVAPYRCQRTELRASQAAALAPVRRRLSCLYSGAGSFLHLGGLQRRLVRAWYPGRWQSLPAQIGLPHSFVFQLPNLCFALKYPSSCGTKTLIRRRLAKLKNLNCFPKVNGTSLPKIQDGSPFIAEGYR
jgi:hypothetical protein